MPTFDFEAYRTIAEAAGDTSLSQISARTGLHKGHLSYLLRGRRQPQLATAQKLAEAYGADLADLVAREAA